MVAEWWLNGGTCYIITVFSMVFKVLIGFFKVKAEVERGIVQILLTVLPNTFDSSLKYF